MAPRLGDEPDSSFETFRAMIGTKDKCDTWGEKFSQDVRNESGMSVLAQLEREDERRRFIERLVAKRKPDSAADKRDQPLVAQGQCEVRRRWLLEALSHDNLCSYVRQLDAVGETLKWDQFRKKIEPKTESPPPLAVADVAPTTEVTGAIDQANVVEPEKNARNGTTEETDETWQDFIRNALVKRESEFWAAKYEADAFEEESRLDVYSRLDREGMRYRNAESMLEEAAGDEWDDLDRARSGAIARRSDIMRFNMTKAERQAYKPRRT